jgi:hypothetical protein
LAQTLNAASLLTSSHGSRSEAQSHTVFFLANASLVLVIVILFSCLRQDDGWRSREDGVRPPDTEVLKPCGFDEDVYMMSIALTARDWQALSKGCKDPGLPAFRMIYTIALVIITITLQGLLLYTTKTLVTPQAVASIRESYDAYEIHMYGGEANTRTLYTGKHRGNPGYFQPELFESLDDTTKGAACQIPFSQLKFLVLVLLIWSFTCVAQLGRCCTYVWNLVVMLPTISSMSDALVFEKVGKPRRKRTIVGLTAGAKMSMLFFICLPWFASTCYLCWLGCRWLTATASFADFIANGMALEFILQFKSLIYYAVCSERTKRDLQTTRHSPPVKYEDAGYFTYFNTLFWGGIAVLWVYLYIFHFQHVLPEYQWDVHVPCTPYLFGS